MDDNTANTDGENNISGDQAFPEKSMDGISKDECGDNSPTAPTEPMHTEEPAQSTASHEKPESKDENTNIGAEAALSSQQETPGIERSPSTEQPTTPSQPIDIKIIYNKKKYDHSIDINSTIADLKKDVEKLTGM